MSFAKVMTAGALLSGLGMVAAGYSPIEVVIVQENGSSKSKNLTIQQLRELPFRMRAEIKVQRVIKKKDESLAENRIISREKTWKKQNYYEISQHISSRFPTEPLLQGKKNNLSDKNYTASIATIEGSRSVTSKAYTASFTNPVTDAVYTSMYGMRHGKHHNGVDIVSSSKNLDIRAAKTGVVVVSNVQSNGLGSLIILDHGNGLESYYAHLSERFVKEGDIVRAGDLIGKMGRTGHATGVHLHFEIRKNNKPLNPLKFLK